jgi:hypothetical protein
VDETEDSPDPNPRGSRRRETRFAGLRLVGIFVPWQAVALTLAVVVTLAGLAAVRFAQRGDVSVHLSSASAEDLNGSSTTTTAPSTTTTSAPETTTSTEPAIAPTSTTSTPPPTTTTTAAPTTTTTAQSHGQETITIYAGPGGMGLGGCTKPYNWDRIKGCPEWAPDESLDFTVNGGAFPDSAQYRLDVSEMIQPNTTSCLRLFDTTTNQAVAGSDHCWQVPPGPNGQFPTEEYGPFKLAKTRDRYTLQARVVRQSDGVGCVGPALNGECSVSFQAAKMLIEW